MNNQQIIEQKKPTLEEQEIIEVQVDEELEKQHHSHMRGVWK